MPNAITEQQIEKAYQLSSLVSQGTLSASAASAALANDFFMNSNSASDYIMVLNAMRGGTVYKRALKIAAYEQYLRSFSNEMNHEEFHLVLRSIELHLEYYQSTVGGKQPSVRRLVDKYQEQMSSRFNVIYPDDVSHGADAFQEGAVKQTTINAYERNPKARTACISHYGAICQICDFNFKSIYGDIGKDFIHVHHKIDLAQIGNTYEVDPINDLIPVCPNCHAMLHTEVPAISIEKLKALMKIL